MTYNARTRDRYRIAVLAVTGAVGAAAIASTGWLAGAAAHDQAAKDAQAQERADAKARAEYAAWVERYGNPNDWRPTIVRERPTKTRVTTRYVTGTQPSTSVGPGGPVTRPSAPQHQVPNPVPPPPPAPPPAPSNGS